MSKIARNTISMTTGLIGQKIISFIYFTLIARIIGPDNLGKYYFAISLTTIFAIFTDIGMAPVLIREVAKYKNRAQEYLSNILIIKLPLILFSILSVALLVNVLHYPTITKQLAYLASIVMALDSFTLVFWGVFRGFQNLKYESYAMLAFQVILAILGLSFLKMGFGLRMLMLALILSSLFNFLYSLILLKIKLKIRIVFSYNKKIFITFLKLAIPFALAGIFNRVYIHLDNVLLSIMDGDRSVGIYSVAYKITFALQFIPMAFSASIYPAMSRVWKKIKLAGVEESDKQVSYLQNIYFKSMVYLAIIVMPISFGIASIADKVILIYKQAFISAVLPLQIMMIGLIFMFLNFPVGALLNSCDRQAINTRNMGLAMLLSIVMNIILIHYLHFVGAAITMATTHSLLFFFNLHWVKNILKSQINWLIFRKILKIIFSAAIMAILTIYLKQFLNIFIVIFLSAIIYLIMLLIIRVFNRDDLRYLFNFFRNFRTE